MDDEIRLRYVRYDYALNEYDYALGSGEEPVIEAVYRDGIKVDPREYKVFCEPDLLRNEDTWFIRFFTEQRDFDNRFHSLTAIVDNLEEFDKGFPEWTKDLAVRRFI